MGCCAVQFGRSLPTFQRCFIIKAMIALMMEAARTSETPVNYLTTQRSNPEDSHL
jgi:hypothetical protein